jgi:DnaJ-domain-containing protein 1
MTDCFALFSESRRPWLDASELKNKFHAMAATRHPDAGTTVDSGSFTALNAAYATLRDPARRLRHLLELEHPAVLANTPPIPADIANCFMSIAGHRDAIRAMRRRKSAGSPLACALLADEKAKIDRSLREALCSLEKEYANALAALHEIDAAWPSRDAALLARAVTLQARLAYLERWTANVREARLEMTT